MSTTRVTLADVAADAGVHPATVSRAVSRPDLVNATTLARVTESVERLGYVPNRAARQLAGGTTSMVAVIVPDIGNPYFAGLVQAIQRRAAESRLLTVLAGTDLDATTEVEVIATLAPNVDGLLVCAPTAATDDLLEAAAGRRLQFVGRRSRRVPWVVADQRLVVRLAVDHLRALGHERIAVVAGPGGYWSSQERGRETAADGGLVVLGPVEPTHVGGRELLGPVVDAGVTAVVAFNDIMALGLIDAAASAGLSVPDDLSVVGSDDIPMAPIARPPLTTVGTPLDELGVAAFDALRAGTADTPPPDVSLEPYLVERATTAPPPEASSP